VGGAELSGAGVAAGWPTSRGLSTEPGACLPAWPPAPFPLQARRHLEALPCALRERAASPADDWEEVRARLAAPLPVPTRGEEWEELNLAMPSPRYARCAAACRSAAGGAGQASVGGGVPGSQQPGASQGEGQSGQAPHTPTQLLASPLPAGAPGLPGRWA
jgi:hypothetical protein